MHIGGGGFFFAGSLVVGFFFAGSLVVGFFFAGFLVVGFFFAGFLVVGFFFAGSLVVGFFFAGFLVEGDLGFFDDAGGGFFFAGFFLVLEFEGKEGGLVEVGRMRGEGVVGMRSAETLLLSAPVIFVRGGSWMTPSFCCHSVLCLAISDAMEIPAVCTSGSYWLSGLMRKETYACRSVNSDDSSEIEASMGLVDDVLAFDWDAQLRISKMRSKQQIISIL